MRKERIMKFGKLVYMKLFNDRGYLDDSRYQYYRDKKGKDFDCKKIFWRVYKVI